MAIALAFGVTEKFIGFAAIDDEVAVEVGAENFLRHIAAAAVANGVDGGVLAGEDPQPGVGAADAPAGLVGVDDLGPPESIEEQIVGGTGQVGQAFLGADERRRTNFQVAVRLQEVADFAIADAESMLDRKSTR